MKNYVTLKLEIIDFNEDVVTASVSEGCLEDGFATENEGLFY